MAWTSPTLPPFCYTKSRYILIKQRRKSVRDCMQQCGSKAVPIFFMRKPLCIYVHTVTENTKFMCLLFQPTVSVYMYMYVSTKHGLLCKSTQQYMYMCTRSVYIRITNIGPITSVQEASHDACQPYTLHPLLHPLHLHTTLYRHIITHHTPTVSWQHMWHQSLPSRWNQCTHIMYMQ